MTHMIDKKLLSILVCPITRSALIYDEAKQELISLAAAVAYPIRDGIPVMLETEARPLTQAEIDAHRAN